MKPVELAYHVFGDPSAPPLLILHGLFASSTNWNTLAKRFSSRFRVLTPDLRNHGASPQTEAMDYPHMTADLCTFLDAQGIARASLIGHSMGGKAAMWLALNSPQRVDKLVVVDIAPVAYSHSYAGLIRALKRLPLDRIKNRKEADHWLEERIPDARLRQFLLQNLVFREQRYHWRIYLDALLHAVSDITGFPETEEGMRFTGNTLFLSGEHSDYVKPEHRRIIQSLFPNARFETIEGAGHWLYAEQPERFAQVLIGFLAGQPG